MTLKELFEERAACIPCNSYIEELYLDCLDAEIALKQYEKYGDGGQRSSAMRDKLEQAYLSAREAYLVAKSESVY